MELSFLPEKGPEYSDPFAQVDTIPLYRIKTVKRVQSDDAANDAIWRGRHMLALDVKAELDGPRYELANRTTIFGFGHPEEAAI